MKTKLWSKKSPKEKILRSITFLALLSVSLSVAAWAIAYAQKQDPKSADTTRPKTLRERALERDIEFDMLEGHFDQEYGDLRWLAKHSDAIVLGRLLEGESFFNGDNHISTKYVVDLSRIIKDGTSESILLWQSLGWKAPPQLATPFRFVRPGGTVYVNGHRASMKLKGSEILTLGRSYVLFLHWTGGYYRLAGGMSGAVLIDDNFRAKPLGTNQALKLKNYDKLSFDAFIEEVLKEPAP